MKRRVTTQQIAAGLVWLIGAILIAHANVWYILVHGVTTFALLRWSFVLPDTREVQDRTPLDLLRVGGPPIGARMLGVFDTIVLAGGLVMFAGADITRLTTVNGIAILLSLVIGALLAVGPYAMLETSLGNHNTRNS